MVSIDAYANGGFLQDSPEGIEIYLEHIYDRVRTGSIHMRSDEGVGVCNDIANFLDSIGCGERKDEFYSELAKATRSITDVVKHYGMAVPVLMIQSFCGVWGTQASTAKEMNKVVEEREIRRVKDVLGVE